MKFVSRLFPAIGVFALLLSGCFDDPKLRADTEADFSSSLEAVNKGLSGPEREKLDAALKDIVLVQIGFYGPLFTAKNFRPPVDASNAASKNPFSAFSEGLAAATLTAAGGVVATGFDQGWMANRPKAVVQNARAIVDGRSAKEIIDIANTERKRAMEAALAIYHEQLVKAKSALNDLSADALAADRTRDEQKDLLARIEITKPRFTKEKSMFSEDPVISFTIANKGPVAVKKIFLGGKVQTPGRSIPWVSHDLNYEFPGGLEPGETKSLKLSPWASDWNKVPAEFLQGVLLDLTLTAFEDAAGKRFGSGADDREPLNTRKKALDAGIQTLEGKITDLENQLQQGQK